MTLPCIVHRVKVVRLKREDHLARSYVYGIEAIGLQPLEIVLSEKLVESRSWSLTRPPYALVRPWDWKLLDWLVECDSAAALKWLVQLEQPFSPLLLTELPHNEYKRIMPLCVVSAYPAKSGEVLKGEPRMLNVV